MAVQDSTAQQNRKPAWLAPVIIVVIIAVLGGASMKKKEVLENPIVDLVIITVGVFAFAAIFRVLGSQLGAPGMTAFFGGSADSATKGLV
jgi:tellurite resistance protein TehA-like permease